MVASSSPVEAPGGGVIVRRWRLPLAPFVVFMLIITGSSIAAANPLPSVYVVLPQSPPTRAITVSGTVGSLTISRNDGGGKTATGASLSYATTGTGDQITVSIDSDTDTGVTLSVIASNIACAPPCSGMAGTATGYQALSKGANSLITGIGAISGGSATADLTYKIATDSAPVGEVTKTVTFTIGA